MYDHKEYQRKYQVVYRKQKGAEYWKQKKKEHYQRNREIYLKRAAERRKKRKEELGIEDRKKKVALLEYETGEVVATYTSMTEAAEDNFTSKNHLRVALKKQGGFMKQKKLRFKYMEG